MPAVSVILPTCDRSELWPRALASVLRQSWTDLEVVLIDSNRQTPPIAAKPEWATLLSDPRVVVVALPHAPCAAGARNLGLKAAKGEWITYLDDDDEYEPGKVAAQLSLARDTGAPLVLCGYTVVLPHRRRTRQVSRAEFRGDDLLIAANWGTPMLFHRREPQVWFDERLRAGEDEAFAHRFIERNGVQFVPNCARSLVTVHPQVGAARVHRGEVVWKAYQATWRIVRRRYAREARRAYLAMGCIVRAQNGHGSFVHFVRCAIMVLRTRGLGAWRLVANATAHRLGVLSKWAVS
ncbi:MAG: glycosyltransferase family 2 protein [Verrucomicrobia bacterium]|nr:glycosyltransferase family 2 protein [Verrucomicrobiota bacterium]